MRDTTFLHAEVKLDKLLAKLLNKLSDYIDHFTFTKYVPWRVRTQNLVVPRLTRYHLRHWDINTKLLTLTYDPNQSTSFLYLPIQPATLDINKIKAKDFINTSEVLTSKCWTLIYLRKYTHNIFAFETYSFKGLLF